MVLVYLKIIDQYGRNQSKEFYEDLSISNNKGDVILSMN